MPKAQPEINIGLVGHVDHGKTQTVYALSNKLTDTHSEELKRGITIRLGYADASFYKCEKHGYTTKQTCPKCNKKTKFLRKVSFIDAPGHESLMATMLSGAAIMDAALLIIAANESCPQPQTKEHLMALTISNINKIVIAQNKIDLVTEKQAIENYKQIKKFIKGTIAQNAPIIPISAQHNINIDYLIQAIEKHMKTPKRDLKSEPIMLIARSFDINKPGTKISKLVGGVLGGSLIKGKLKINDKIEIKPGIKINNKYQPLKTKICSLRTGNENVKQVIPGGSIGILTKLDPSIVKSDNLIGNVVGHIDKLPKVYTELKLKIKLLDRVVGTKKEIKVEPIKKLETLMLNVNSATTIGTVYKLEKNITHIKLKIPVCMEKTSKISISRKIGDRWRLIALATL